MPNSSSAEYDVAVVGLGAAGAAVLRSLAREGLSVIGADRWDPPHARGSSHGETRLLRIAYGEGPQYVPLARRAAKLWREIEAETGARLFEQAGVVYGGPPSSAFLQSTRSAGEPVRDLDRDEQRAVGFDLPADWLCFLEPGAGFLYAEPAIEALLEDARKHGARTATDTPCQGLAFEGGRVVVETPAGPIRARRCVIAAGSWIRQLLPELSGVLHVERRAIHWFADPTGRYALKNGFRPFYFEDEAGLGVYGVPDWGGSGVKIAEHRIGVPAASPEDLDFTVDAAEQAYIAGIAGRYLPHLGPVLHSTTCHYPMSEDEHFIIDRLPGHDQVVVLAGLSGHGFKFAPVIGEAACDLIVGRTPRVDLAPFALERFANLLEASADNVAV